MHHEFKLWCAAITGRLHGPLGEREFMSFVVVSSDQLAAAPAWVADIGAALDEANAAAAARTTGLAAAGVDEVSAAMTAVFEEFG